MFTWYHSLSIYYRPTFVSYFIHTELHILPRVFSRFHIHYNTCKSGLLTLVTRTLDLGYQVC